MKQTFILFGQAGQNVAQGDPKFCRHLRRAFSCEYTTKDLASAMMMRFAYDASDNHIFTDDGDKIMDGGSIVIKRGELSYEHDSRTWEFILLEELDEKDAAIALRDNVLFDEADKELLYDKYPDLRPVEEE